MRFSPKSLFFAFAILTMGAVLPSSAMGGMILVSLDEVHASTWELAEESSTNSNSNRIPEESPHDGYRPDLTQDSNCGSGETSPQTGPSNSACCAGAGNLTLQPNVEWPMFYSAPEVPPPHLCRLFRPPRC